MLVLHSCWCAPRIWSGGTCPVAVSGAVRRQKQRRGGSWPRRSASLRSLCSLRALPAAFGDGRPTRLHFFELRLPELPMLQLDNREVIAARLTSPIELHGMVLTGPLAAYVGKLRARRGDHLEEAKPNCW